MSMGAALSRKVAGIAHAIVLAWGWKRAAIAFIAGACSALALAPFEAWPVMFLTLPVAVWLIDGAGAGRFNGIPAAALSGWFFGFGYFLAGLYWVGHAFLVDADIFGWLLPFAVVALPAGMAIYMALGFALARLVWTRDASRILSLGAALTATEWLRGHLFSGFPWNALGATLTGPLAFAQIASLIGLWGLTLIAILIFAAPATLFDDRSNTKRPWLAPLLAACGLIALAIFGTARLSANPAGQETATRLRIMQPNLSQDVRFNYAAKADVMRHYLNLSARSTSPGSSGIGGADILIWPESAFPFFLAREPDALAQIASLLPQGAVLITGAVRPPSLQPNAKTTRAYNSIYTIDHQGTILDAYDKLHLVPFGEYLPFQNAMEKLGFQQLTKLRGGYIPGTRRRAIALKNAPPVLPLICYEVIFPGEVSGAGERAGWIVNLTNDGWFGKSSGPYQHLQQARLRAIEEGLPIVRAANTGISAIIDPMGRMLAHLPLGTEGVLDARLPRAISAPFYTRSGDVPLALAVAILFLVALRRRARPVSPL